MIVYGYYVERGINRVLESDNRYSSFGQQLIKRLHAVYMQ